MIAGDLVLGFLTDGFLTRLAIFSIVNFFVLESAPPFTETIVTLFGLVLFEDWIEGNLALGFSADGFLTKLAIYLAIDFFILGSAPPFTETLVTLFSLVYFEDWIEGDLVLGFSADGFLTKFAIFSIVNYFVLGSAPPFTETLDILFGLVHFED